jgi:RNA-directed DNA polymerase
MIERVTNRSNLLSAYQHVLSNKGSAGVDGMGVKELLPYLKENREAIIQAVSEGYYFPQSILGVSIPKKQWKNASAGHSNSS